MSKSGNGQWSTRKFDETLSFVCERPTGDFCLFDMVQHSNFCYDFDLDQQSSPGWTLARDACSASGLQIITIPNQNIDNWITKYLYKTGIFTYPSVTNGMWIGYYGT